MTRQADWHEVCDTHHGVGCGTHLQLHSWRRLRGLQGGVQQNKRSSSGTATETLLRRLARQRGCSEGHLHIFMAAPGSLGVASG